jgi:hypothetical protein
MRRSSRKRVITTRLKAFSSFSDTFSSSSIKSGWKVLSGSWTSGSNNLTGSSAGLISVPLSKSNATVVATIPSGTGVGTYFWGADANNYWASYAVSNGTTTSTCTNNNCSGTENFTNTRSCSCTNGASNCNNGSCSGSENYTATRSCSCSPGASNCNNGSCSGSENYTATRSCSCSTQYGTCAQTTTYGTCSQSTTYGTCAWIQTYGTCAIVNTYGTCSYTPGGTTYTSLGCYSAFSGCNSGNETSCNGPSGMNVCGCPCGVSKVCCYTVTTTSGSWNYVGCSYSGEQVVTGSSWNIQGCSWVGQQYPTGGSWNYSGCIYEGQQVATGTSWNYSGCSSNGQQVVTGTSWNYSGCSSNGQQVVIGSSSTCNSGACSGSENYTASRSCSCPQISNCNNGNCSGSENYTATRSCSCVQISNCTNNACSGTENFTDTRSCSCSTSYSRVLRTVKVVNGVQSTVGEFTIPTNPASIQIVTSGNSVLVSASGLSNSYTNSDGTTNKNFGIIRTSGGSEEISSASAFTATVAL